MISIIVPIYNTEKYLEKCLESIQNQTFTDFEVIMVDDGSTDISAEICKNFANEDSRYKYFYKDNGGEGSARNYGLSKVTGNYITFVDSDDYVAYDYLEVLSADISKGYDIIQCGMYICNGCDQIVLSAKGEYHDNDFIKLVLKRDFPIFLLQTTTTKLYKTELLRKSGILFDSKVIKSVDSLFNTMLLPFVHDILIKDVPKYYYRQDNSYVSKMKPSFNKIYQSIRVGNITSQIRFDLIKELQIENDPEIIQGFQTAICIIYISNAHEIETGGFSNVDKQRLYESFFSVMNYPINTAIDGFEGTDKKIALACAKKDRKTIARIYRLRRIKAKILR